MKCFLICCSYWFVNGAKKTGHKASFCIAAAVTNPDRVFVCSPFFPCFLASFLPSFILFFFMIQKPFFFILTSFRRSLLWYLFRFFQPFLWFSLFNLSFVSLSFLYYFFFLSLSGLFSFYRPFSFISFLPFCCFYSFFFLSFILSGFKFLSCQFIKLNVTLSKWCNKFLTL